MLCLPVSRLIRGSTSEHAPTSTRWPGSGAKCVAPHHSNQICRLRTVMEVKAALTLLEMTMHMELTTVVTSMVIMMTVRMTLPWRFTRASAQAMLMRITTTVEGVGVGEDGGAGDETEMVEAGDEAGAVIVTVVGEAEGENAAQGLSGLLEAAAQDGPRVGMERLVDASAAVMMMVDEGEGEGEAEVGVTEDLEVGGEEAR